MGKSKELAELGNITWNENDGRVELDGSIRLGTSASSNRSLDFSDSPDSDEKWAIYGWGDQLQFSKRTSSWGWASTPLAVDASGHVTMPYQPAFYVKDLNYTFGADSLGTGGVIQTNRGSCYNSSNGRFTAPVSGMYYFWGTQQHFDSGSSTYVGLIFNKNGTQDTIEYVSGVGGSYNNHQTQEGAYVTYLNVNDYVNIRSNRGARNGIQNVFLGYLLG